MMKAGKLLFLMLVVLWGISGSFAVAAGDSFELKITKPAGGEIWNDDQSIRCGNGTSKCALTVKSGTRIRLSAFPNSGWDFGTWSGCTPEGRQFCYVTMDSAKTVSHAFAQKGTVTISINQPIHGVVTYAKDRIAGTAQCPPNCTATATRGERWQATAKGDLGWVLESWGGDCSNRPNPCTLLLDESKGIAANFAPAATYIITITKPANGEIWNDDQSIRCGNGFGKCSLKVTKGSSMRLSGFPNGGRRFGPWSGACGGSTDQFCSITVNGNLTVTRTFP